MNDHDARMVGPVTDRQVMSHAEWLAEGERRFGPDMDKWKFVCPSCGCVASVADWKRLDGVDMIAFSCVGRLTASPKELFDKTGGPCNYAGGGLFRLNPIIVVLDDGSKHECFAFAAADKPLPAAAAGG